MARIRFSTGLSITVLTALALACSLDPSPAPPANTFTFGVFGDGPYRVWEVGRFRHLLHDVSKSDIDWLIHVGDIFWYPCSNANYQRSLKSINSIQHPVIYTPGDNEWTDCHFKIAGGHEPLERLDHLRKTFYTDPSHSLGARRMPIESQSQSGRYPELVENARWVHGGFVFITIHMVGSENGTEEFRGRQADSDAEAARRIAGSLEWMHEAFALADSTHAHGVVIAMHGSPGLQYHPRPRPGFEKFLDELETRTKTFKGRVLLIHGDGHQFQVDHPLRDRATYEPLPNFTRLETFGSPDIGWVRVVVDSVNGEFVSFEPRVMKRWWIW